MRKLGLGLGLSRGRRGPSGPTYSVSISGLTSNPTYGSTAQIGVELTASASGWSGDAPASVAWQWYDGSGAISGATSATYTPVSGDDLEAIYATATPSDTYDPKNSAAYTVRYAPPVAAGGISDQIYTVGAAISTLDVSADFTGSGITYALGPASAALPAGLSLASNGQITGTPTTEGGEVIIVVRGTNSGGYAATAFGITVNAASGAVTVDSVSVGSFSGGALPITITATDVANGNDVYWVLTTAANAPANNPTGAAQVVAGNDSTNSAAIDSGTDVWPGPFSDTLVANIARGNYVLTVVIDNGALSNVVTSAAFEVDTTAGTLSSPLGADGGGSLDWSVTYNDTVGTITARLYDDADTPSDADVIAGTGAVDTSTDASPTADGANGGTFGGVTPGDYKVHIFATDDYGNVSNVVATSTVTVSASGLTVTFAKNGTYATVDGTTVSDSYDVGAAAAGKELWIVLTHGNSTGTTPPDMAIAGSPATLVSSRHTNVNTMCSIIRGDASAGGVISFSFTPVVPVQWRGLAWRVYVVEGRSTELGDSDANTSYGAMDLSNSVLNGQHVLGVAGMAVWGTTGTLTAVGLTEQAYYTGLNGTKKSLFYDNAITATEAPRTMTLTPTGDGNSAVSSCIAIIG